MTTPVYCSIEDISDYLRVPITATTSPNKTQVTKIINRKEGEFERRTGHAWRETKSYKEVYDLRLNYVYGWGTPINLKHRLIYDLDASEGDMIEVWNGSASTYTDILANDSWYDIEPVYGRLYLRGYMFTVLRKSRVRVTYRYGGELFVGDTTIPDDIKDCIIKMVCTELINTSFRMDELPSGGMIDIQAVKRDWKDDIEKCIDNRKEVFVIP